MLFVQVDCLERDRLWREYEYCVNRLCGIVEKLSTSSAVGFNASVIASKTAKDACIRAQGEWEKHLRDHRCDGHRLVRAAGSSMTD